MMERNLRDMYVEVKNAKYPGDAEDASFFPNLMSSFAVNNSLTHLIWKLYVIVPS